MIALRTATLHRAELRTRMPFRYGITTMTRLPHVFLAATWTFGARAQNGLASENLPPKWFTKDAARDPRSEIDEMLAVIRAAVDCALALPPARDVFSWWLTLQQAMADWGRAHRLPPLLTGLGISLIERSLLDAFCRTHNTPLATAVRENLLGVRLDAIHPELGKSPPSNFIPDVPLSQVELRHTVGLADPLTTADTSSRDTDAPKDGLPFTLEEAVKSYGLRAFKLKLSGSLAEDEARLEATFAVLDRTAPPDWRFSLDGNENFPTSAAFRERWETMAERTWLRNRLHRLLFVEQPVRRDEALTPAANWHGWVDAPPIIIDESDGEPASLREALALGYRGVSHKNCKGVFRGLANACLLRKRATSERLLLMSGEDLANIGPVALLQDLSVQALLGNTSVERNGHHYFAGLSAWPQSWQDSVLKYHSDLYAPHPHVCATVRISHGRLELGSLNSAPFGLRPLLDLSGLQRITTV